MKHHAIFTRIKDQLYLCNGASDDSVFTLYMFLGDGLYRESYLDFLASNDKYEFLGNISRMTIHGDRVIVHLYDTIFAKSVPFCTTKQNLVTIINEWDRLRSTSVQAISFNLDNDILVMEEYHEQNN